ncbi:MAG: cytochrome c oxidase subunit II, partial [Acidobacteriota bacterium]|nr:cytochrome c oxidase subunit II [Acidobacteriota bacterium]
VFVLVIFATLAAVIRSRSRQSKAAKVEKITEEPKLAQSNPEEQRMARTVQGAVAVTVLILFVFLIASFSIGRSLTSYMENKGVVTIEVTGHQWWWEVRYMDPNPSKIFTTANEIHIPVGQPVTLKLHSTDVIHSFWVPNLNGKKDLIPGKDSTIWLQADQPGVYRGQCAEYCGLQHAHMALFVFAEPVDKFNTWLDSQRAEAVAPSTESEQRGQQVFLTAPCIMCHAIHGTQASATVGPNLTHVASRSTIAAGTLPFTRGHLAGWIIDSQSIKPGNHMPPIALNSEDLQALLDYLQSLK